MSTTFQTELDGTNGAAVTADPTTGGNSGLDILTGSWTYTTATKASGTASATMSLTAGTGMLTRTHTSGSVTVRYYDFFYRFSTLDGGNIMFAQTKLGAASTAHLDLTAAGTIVMKNANTTVATTGTVFTPNEWFRVQWGIDGATQTIRVWKDATIANLFTSTPTETKTGTYSQGPWDAFKVGCNVIHTMQLWVDKIVMDNVTWPATGTSGNVPPTANAGTDQSVSSGATVTLTGSASSDSDGTIASYLWNQTGGPAVTLSSTTVVGPTFTAPAVSAATNLTFSLQVTDNQGATATDTIVVTVSPSSGTSSALFSELFNAGTTGVALSTSNTGFTLVDAGWTFSATAIGEGSHAATLTTTAGVAVLSKTMTIGPEFYIDAIFKMDNITSGNGPFYLLRARSGATVRASVRLNDGSVGGTTAGTLQMRNGTTAGTATTATVTAGQIFRLQWHINNTTTTQTLKLFTGSNLLGSTPDTGGNISGTFNTGTVDQLAVGQTLISTGTLIVDTVQMDTTVAPTAVIGSSVSSHSNLWIMQSDGTWLERDFTVFT